jgi:two-component SAPR family response regulator
MKQLLSSIFWIVIFSNSLYSQTYGLQFSSHEVVPEKRTSLNLTSSESLCFKENTTVSFDLKFVSNKLDNFGYIIRIITNNEQNIDIVYNQKKKKFNFVIGEAFSNDFAIESSKLFGQWNNCKIQFDVKAQEVIFYLNKQFICKSKLTLTSATCCKIFFGTNNLEKFKTIDVPPMQIKDISISRGNKQLFLYPLLETSGNLAIDNIEKRTASVSNPNWITPKHQNWNQINNLVVSGSPSIAFDKINELLYIVSIDSIFQFSFKTNQLKVLKLSKSMMQLLAGNQSIFNNSLNTLYNFYIDKKIVSSYNRITNTWEPGPVTPHLTEFWQANKFISAYDSSLYIFGGYGQLQYKNQVQRYDFSIKKWEVIEPKGDFFMPRYLAALGTNTSSDTAYIIGGYGSKSGDQTINPKYNYQLMAYSARSNSFKHIYTLKQPEKEFCFSNSLIIDSATKSYYGLIYPIDRFNSSLQLIKGSLSSPNYELMADSIPYSFHDIESFSDLFYCSSSQKLVAVTLLTQKNISTNIKIYTLDFPPNKISAPTIAENQFLKVYWFFALLFLFLIPISIFIALKRRKNNSVHQVSKGRKEIRQSPSVHEDLADNLIIPSHGLYETESITSSIFLFGHFEVIDKNGNDITRQFTPLLKEMFLLILLYTFKDGKGISSDQLYEILWGDKAIKDARNNFSVNILKLKSILEKVGESYINKESGKWKFEIVHDSMKIDYVQFINLSNEQHTIFDKGFITELLSFIKKGAFLREVQYSWIDDFKSTVSDFIITTLLTYTTKATLHAEPELILKITNCIFHFDQMNEEALSFKCRSLIILGRHAIAKEIYLNFCKEYKKNYGEEFVKTYNEIIEST